MTWIFEKAQERAAKYNIKGVTYNLTMGVVKNIIPAIASTNALIAAACVTEAFKVLSGCNVNLDNYMQYMGQTGVSTTTYVAEKNDNCPVCNVRRIKIEATKDTKLKNVFETIKDRPETFFAENEKFEKTSFNTNQGLLYIPAPPVLE